MNCSFTFCHCLPVGHVLLTPFCRSIQLYNNSCTSHRLECKNKYFWDFLPQDVKYNQYDKYIAALISPAENIHLNFSIMREASVHIWIYFSFRDCMKQLVSVRFCLSHAPFFCSFLFSINLMEKHRWFEPDSAISNSTSLRWYIQLSILHLGI